MNTLTLKLKRMSLTSRILFSTVGLWFASTFLLIIWLHFNWNTMLTWLLG
jgi:hypothetical protein